MLNILENFSCDTQQQIEMVRPLFMQVEYWMCDGADRVRESHARRSKWIRCENPTSVVDVERQRQRRRRQRTHRSATAPTTTMTPLTVDSSACVMETNEAHRTLAKPMESLCIRWCRLFATILYEQHQRTVNSIRIGCVSLESDSRRLGVASKYPFACVCWLGLRFRHCRTFLLLSPSFRPLLLHSANGDSFTHRNSNAFPFLPCTWF